MWRALKISAMQQGMKNYATSTIYRGKLINLTYESHLFQDRRVSSGEELDNLFDTMSNDGWLLHEIVPLTHTTGIEGQNPVCTQLLVVVKKDVKK